MSDNIDELINQMNPKRDPEEINMNKNKPAEKFKKTVKEADFDYYKILGVKPTATPLEVKRAYQAKLKKLNPGLLNQSKEDKVKYRLLREAGDLLTDPLQRKAYDMQKKVDSNHKDFDAQKDSFKEFLKLQEQNMTDEDKAIAKLNFERGKASFDQKHGYNRKEMDKVTKEECDRRAEDMDFHRKQQDIELLPDDVFKGRQFNPVEFNRMFEKKKRRDEKRKGQGGLAKVNDGISAFNDFDGGSGGVALDQYDNLYTDGTYNDYNESYGGLSAGMYGADNGKSDDDISIDSLDENDDNYDKHNKGISKESLDAVMKRMMADRDDQDKVFDKMETKEFGSAIDDKYGISSQFGFMVGTDKFGHQKNIKRRRAKEDQLKAYKELTDK